MASFNYAKRYVVEAECVSPLRTGDTDGDNNVVLTGTDGKPMIQATSIAGVLRSWFDNDEALARALFGDSNASKEADATSKVTVSDGVFRRNITILRPRLRINSDTGAGMDGYKYDLRSIPPGEQFTFTLLLKADSKESSLESPLEEALSALNAGLLTLGGQQSNGFGMVKLNHIMTRTYDLKKREDREAWMDDAECDSELKLQPLLDVKKHTITFRLSGCSDHFLIKSGNIAKRENPQEEGKSPSVISAMKNPDGNYVLPGSSLKGVLRSRAKRIAAYKNAEDAVDLLFGREGKGNGDNGQAGQLCVEEFVLEKPRQQILTRTRLDRFTGGVLRKHLFTEETLCDQVSITIHVKCTDPKSNALLFYALRDLAMGLYGFGSEGSVGRGYLTAEASRLEVSNGTSNCVMTFGKKGTIEGCVDFVRSWLNALDSKEVC